MGISGLRRNGGRVVDCTYLGGEMKKNSISGSDSYERQAAICKAFANPTRLQLIDLLGRKERWASELQEGLGISKANLSQHLAVLRAAGVVSTQREGKQLYCGISMPEVRQTSALLRNMTKAVSRASRRQSL
jgi:ArsR family transcriptional regulator